jgi:Fe2+ or Zn2+ uptake regulation protein
MRIEEVAKGLCSQTRVNIIKILAEGDASAVSVYKEYNARFSERKERGTIYRDLEVLYRCNFLFKRYDTGTTRRSSTAWRQEGCTSIL